MKYPFLSVVVFILSLTVAGAQVRFETKVSSQNITATEELQLTFTLYNAKAQEFTPPDLSCFQVLAGPNKSSSYQWINGKESNSIAYTYVLVPRGPGSCVINAAKVKVEGNWLATQPVTIRIDKADNKTRQSLSKDGFAVVCNVSTKNTYPGGQVLVDYILHTNVAVSQIALPPLQNVPGATCTPLTQEDMFHDMQVQGYAQSQIIRRYVVFPHISGTISIPALRGQVDVENGNGLFPGYDTRPVRFLIPETPLRVAELPPAPSDFKGGVGQFTCRLSLEAVTIAADDAGMLQLELTGDGDPTMMQAPRIIPPGGCDIYTPKLIDTKQSETDSGIVTTKIFSYALVPGSVGQYTFTAHYPFFNPRSGQYETAQSNTITLHVDRNAPSQGPPRDITDNNTFDKKLPVKPLWLIIAGLALGMGFLIYAINRRAKQKTTFRFEGTRQRAVPSVAEERTPVLPVVKYPSVSEKQEPSITGTTDPLQRRTVAPPLQKEDIPDRQSGHAFRHSIPAVLKPIPLPEASDYFQKLHDWWHPVLGELEKQAGVLSSYEHAKLILDIKQFQQVLKTAPYNPTLKGKEQEVHQLAEQLKEKAERLMR